MNTTQNESDRTVKRQNQYDAKLTSLKQRVTLEVSVVIFNTLLLARGEIAYVNHICR